MSTIVLKVHNILATTESGLRRKMESGPQFHNHRDNETMRRRLPMTFSSAIRIIEGKQGRL
jgi:hypothetical protein